MHRHECQCGNAWEHSDDNAGNVQAHTCTACGREVWHRSNHLSSILKAHLRTAYKVGCEPQFPNPKLVNPAAYNDDDWNNFDEETGVYPNSYYIEYYGENPYCESRRLGAQIASMISKRTR